MFEIIVIAIWFVMGAILLAGITKKGWIIAIAIIIASIVIISSVRIYIYINYLK